MLLQIPDVLNVLQLNRFRAALEAANWTDGKISDRSAAEDLRSVVLGAVEAAPKFVSAALPVRILPPVFLRDVPGETPPHEVNEAIRTIPGGSTRIRSDLTATMFLSEPDTYEGGDLVFSNTHSEQCVKLPAGHVVLYSSGSRQRFQPVTHGTSFCCMLWVQSMIRDHGQRKLLFDMDIALQNLSEKMPDDPSIIELTGVYHKLLRYWAQV